jgi:DNA-binding NtrC family response regulator
MARARVLIIEDDETVRATLVELLRIEGYEVSGVRGPTEARDLLEGTGVDIVITDSYEPTWDPSLAWLAPLSEVAGSARLILHTGYREAAALSPEKAGLAAVWAKPMDLDAIVAGLEDVLGRGDNQGGS